MLCLLPSIPTMSGTNQFSKQKPKKEWPGTASLIFSRLDFLVFCSLYPFLICDFLSRCEAIKAMDTDMQDMYKGLARVAHDRYRSRSVHISLRISPPFVLTHTCRKAEALANKESLRHKKAYIEKHGYEGFDANYHYRPLARRKAMRRWSKAKQGSKGGENCEEGEDNELEEREE